MFTVADPMLGAHVSTAGGLHNAPERGREIAAEAIQVFTRNQVHWAARPVSRSEAAFLAEMRRCHALGIPYLVFHPGAHLGAGEEEGLRRVAESLNHALDRGHGLAVMPLLEVTAGQGSSVGHSFEHLARILEQLETPLRVGVCLDTCHLLAAGYDIATPRGYARTMEDLDQTVGLSRVKAFHLNDAKRGLG